MCKKIKKLWEKALTFATANVMIKSQSRETTPRQYGGKCQKGEKMEDLNLSEMLREVTEENQTRKILDILKESKNLDEAIEKVKALLNK